MSNNSKKHQSLRFFSWCNDESRGDLESLIENTANEWYEAKHPKTSQSEIDFINSIKIYKCPFCGGMINKNGHRKDGIQEYKCKECFKKFNALTNTIFDNHKIPISEWIEYLLHLFEFHSIKSSAFDNRNASTTGRFWLEKVFIVLDGIQNDVVLNGTVYIDETYLIAVKSKKIKKDGKYLRGLSRNTIPIATGTDGTRSFFITISRNRTPTDQQVFKAYKNHIAFESLLIHDGAVSHMPIIDELALKSQVHLSTDTKRLKDEENPLDPINDLHSLFKRFMRSHGGFDRDYAQDWCNLFYFIVNPPHNKYEKVKIFIERALKIHKNVEFRELFEKK